MVFRAPSTAVLSPPERIHLMPPQIKKNNAITAAATRRIIIIRVITVPILPKLSEQSALKLAPGTGCDGQIFICAEAGSAEASKNNTEKGNDSKKLFIKKS